MMKFNHSAASSLKVPAGTVFRILNKIVSFSQSTVFINFCLQNGTSFGKSQLLNVPTLVKSKQKQKWRAKLLYFENTDDGFDRANFGTKIQSILVFKQRVLVGCIVALSQSLWQRTRGILE